MRILWIIPGGVDRSGRRRVIPSRLWLLERLARRFDMHVVATNQEEEPCEYELLGAQVHCLARMGPRRQILEVARLIRRLRPVSLLHVFWPHPAPIVAGPLAGAWRLPVVVTLCGGELVALRDIAYGGARRLGDRLMVGALLARASVVTAASGPMIALARTAGIRATPVPLGVDRHLFQPPETRPDGPPWQLLHVASLNRVKDQETLLRAFARIRQQRDDVYLTIAGVDTLGGAAERLAASLDVSDRVAFLGHQPTETVAALGRAAHLFVLTSRHESGPVALLEAAACGVPAVGTGVGHLADWAREGLAVAVDPQAADALAAETLALLDDPPRRAALAAAAHAWTVAHDADWTAGEFARIYEQLAERHQGAGRA